MSESLSYWPKFALSSEVGQELTRNLKRLQEYIENVSLIMPLLWKKILRDKIIWILFQWMRILNPFLFYRQPICFQGHSPAWCQQSASVRPWGGAWYLSNLYEQIYCRNSWCWGRSAYRKDKRTQRLVKLFKTDKRFNCNLCRISSWYKTHEMENDWMKYSD